MPRVDDRPFPTLGGPRPSPEPWPGVLHIAVERMPVPVNVWDDFTARYDDPEGDYTWDDRTLWPYARQDLFCRFHGLTIETGSPEEGAFDAGHVDATFDNRDGALSIYDAQGRLVDWQIGAAFDVWVDYAGTSWWLFSGRVTAWRERVDGMLEVEAFDAFSDMNYPVQDWTPGNHGDTPSARLTKITNQFGFNVGRRFDVGNVNLYNYLTDATPLEEMQSVAISDGGILGVDADGTLVYRGRDWVGGRHDQTTRHRFSDNYCDDPAVLQVWDAEMTTDDETLINVAWFKNVADVEVFVENVTSIDNHGSIRRTLEHTDDQWIGAAQGNELAAWYVFRHDDAYLRLERFVVYVADPRQNYWPFVTDLRLGDVVEWMHEQVTTTGPRLIHLDFVVSSIVHDITPELWVTSVATTKATGSHYLARWDMTDYVWDDDDPAADWAA